MTTATPVANLYSLLKEYGNHKLDCNKVLPPNFPNQTCDCGWEEISKGFNKVDFSLTVHNPRRHR